MLYCDNLSSKKRKDCVIVLNIILESLLKWFAPILVFTTDEIYSLISKGEKNIHEYSFIQVPESWENKNLNNKWDELFKIKQEANIAIEEKRSSKEIGSSLEADVKLILEKKKFELLDKIDLAEYLITSKAEKILSKNNETKIEVIKAKGNKCQRCWKILENKCNRPECPIKNK